jgi:hypothetical protein
MAMDSTEQAVLTLAVAARAGLVVEQVQLSGEIIHLNVLLAN